MATDGEDQVGCLASIAGWVIMALLAVGALVVVGIGIFAFHPDSPLRDPGLEETVAASEAVAPNFAVGACVDEVSAPTVVPCDQPHRAEVYAILEVDTENGDRPTGKRLGDFGAQRCPAHFEGYVGSTPQAAGLYTTTEASNDDQWAIGAKYILCLVVADPSFSPTTGSVKGTGG